MLGYVTLGTNDLGRARAFYDALLGEIGATRKMQFEETGFTLYGTGGGAPGIAVTRPYDGGEAAAGNGNMAAIAADSRDDGRPAPCQGDGIGRQRMKARRACVRPTGRGPFTAPISAISTATSSAPSGWGRAEPMRVRVIVNKGGGTSKGDAEEAARIGAALEAEGVEADVRPTEPAELPAAFREAAAADGLDAVVAGGGDGTLSCCAGQLADTGRPMGILPLGTLNHLARDVGIPAKLEDAAAIIAKGHVRPIDLAEVNGEVFINNSAVGLYPDMVRLREAEQERKGRGKRLAMLSASWASLRHFRRHRLWISAPGLEAPVRTPLLFVGNNRYQVNLLALGQRERLDEGLLCLYAIRARSRAHLFWAGHPRHLRQARPAARLHHRLCRPRRRFPRTGRS